MADKTWLRPEGLRGKFHLVDRLIEPQRAGVDAFVAACGRTIFGRRRGEHWEVAPDLTNATGAVLCVDCLRWPAWRGQES